jgi:uncharacterized protein
MKKVLSIDGGGIKGVFPASFLATIEQTLDLKVADYFDLIVGTSTGGIIALALGLGLSAQETLGFYEKYGSEIFYGSRIWRSLRHWGLSKFDNKRLRQALENTFGETQLGNSQKRLVIPAMVRTTGEHYIYKTAHHEKFQLDYKVSVVDVALATSAAPTFFPSHVAKDGTPMLDGGVWANNPTGLAVVEAIGVLKWKPDEINVLSLGCTSEPMAQIWGKRGNHGLLYWAGKMTQTFMLPQSTSSMGTAHTLVGHDNVYRVSPVVALGQFALDSYKSIDELKGLGNTEARKALPFVKNFFSDEADIFEPIHKL